MQKSFLVYSKILCVRNAFQLCWNEIAISGKKKQYLVIELRPPCSFKKGHFTSFIGRERLKMY